MNYYSIFELPPKFDLDLKELERRFYKESMRLHPDRNPDLLNAAKLTADLNEAYRTLRDPWLRAEYFLKEKGGSLDSKIPPHLAEIYFELQEQNKPEILLSLKDRLQTQVAHLEQKLLDLGRDLDAESSSSNCLQRLRDLISERKYLSSMLRDIDQRCAKV